MKILRAQIRSGSDVPPIKIGRGNPLQKKVDPFRAKRAPQEWRNKLLLFVLR